MKNYILLSVLFVFALLNKTHCQKTIIHCGQLFDAADGEILENRSVVVEGERITEIVEGFVDVSPDENLVDCRDLLVLPGLIDLHVHIETESNPDTYINKFRHEKELLSLQAYAHGMKTLKAGFTTVRDLGGTGANAAYRDAVARGIVQGPRVYTCRKSLAITGGHADPTNGMKVDLQGQPNYQQGVCNGADECAKAVRWQAKQGADLIKITATGGVLSMAKDGDGPAFTVEEIEAIVRTANDRGLHVAAHAHGKEGMMRAVLAGVKTIEHGTYMDEEVMQLMIDMDAYYVPTITAGWAVAENAKIDGYFPDLVRPKAARIGPQIQETFAKAYAFGVPIAFGTDAGVFDHGMNAKEFELMTEVGMPMIEALQSATVVAAKLLKAENQIGDVKPDMFADIIAVSKAAIENPKEMMNVPFVMKNGEVIVAQ